MSVRRDTRTGNWFFRARVTYPDGKRDRIFGTPGVPGPYHDLPNTKVGAQEAERRAIASAMAGYDMRPVFKEVPTIRDYVTPFLDLYSAGHKPSSKQDKKQRLEHDILPAVGDIRLCDLTQEHVDQIKKTMLARGASGKQVNNSLAVLSSLVKYAVKNRVIDDPNLSFFIKTQDTEIDPVAPADVDRLVAKAEDGRYRVAILLGADAGLRIGEIRALEWPCVNELGREITIEQSYDADGHLTATKGWKRRTVPMSDRLWVQLRNVKRRGALVFSRLDGEMLSYDTAAKAIRELYIAAGVRQPMKPWHSLRHTFGTELANAGVEIQTIRELMGHERIETTLRYIHTGRDQKRAAIAKLAPRGSHWAATAKRTT